MRRRGHGRHAYLALLLALAAQRGLELLISRRNERRAGAAIGTAAARSYPLMVLLHTALIWLPLLERRLRPRRPRPALVASALLTLAAATVLRLWAIRTLGRNWNVRGRVHADLVVVAGGPYRYVRHPNYVAVALELAALPLAGSAPLSALALSAGNALVLAPRIRAEEALLAGIPGYGDRMGGKPRFLPRLFGRKGRYRPSSPSPSPNPGERGRSSVLDSDGVGHSRCSLSGAPKAAPYRR